MYLRLLLKLVLIVALGVIQIAFIPGLPGILANINLVLVILLLIMGLTELRRALTWAIATGFIIDLYSFSFFGLHMVSYSCVLFVASFLLGHVFTNRSLYTFLVLTMIATISFEIVSLIIAWSASFAIDASLPRIGQAAFWLDELYKLLANLGMMFLLFHVVDFFSQRFRPIFLSR